MPYIVIMEGLSYNFSAYSILEFKEVSEFMSFPNMDPNIKILLKA